MVVTFVLFHTQYKYDFGDRRDTAIKYLYVFIFIYFLSFHHIMLSDENICIRKSFWNFVKFKMNAVIYLILKCICKFIRTVPHGTRTTCSIINSIFVCLYFLASACDANTPSVLKCASYRRYYYISFHSTFYSAR